MLGAYLLDHLILKGVGEVEQKKKPKKKERKEHLSFKDIEELMGVHEQVLKKKHGAYKRVR